MFSIVGELDIADCLCMADVGMSEGSVLDDIVKQDLSLWCSSQEEMPGSREEFDNLEPCFLAGSPSLCALLWDVTLAVFGFKVYGWVKVRFAFVIDAFLPMESREWLEALLFFLGLFDLNLFFLFGLFQHFLLLFCDGSIRQLLSIARPRPQIPELAFTLLSQTLKLLRNLFLITLGLFRLLVFQKLLQVHIGIFLNLLHSFNLLPSTFRTDHKPFNLGIRVRAIAIPSELVQILIKIEDRHLIFLKLAIGKLFLLIRLFEGYKVIVLFQLFVASHCQIGHIGRLVQVYGEGLGLVFLVYAVQDLFL